MVKKKTEKKEKINSRENKKQEKSKIQRLSFSSIF